jgi:hypothetical protein
MIMCTAAVKSRDEIPSPGAPISHRLRAAPVPGGAMGHPAAVTVKTAFTYLRHFMPQT